MRGNLGLGRLDKRGESRSKRGNEARLGAAVTWDERRNVPVRAGNCRAQA